MSEDQSLAHTGTAVAANGQIEIPLTREARLTATLKDLDAVADPSTGELLPQTSRDRAIFELIALVAYAVGKGIDPNDLCAVGELLRALDDAQRGNPHPMLAPEPRPVDPRHDDGRKKGGRSRGMCAGCSIWPMRFSR